MSELDDLNPQVLNPQVLNPQGVSPQVIERLGALGHQPVDPEVSARHTAMLASLEPMEVSHRRGRQVLAGTLVAGALFGGGGLAGALTGTLPDPVQDTARSALSKVGVDVPKGDGHTDDPATAGRDAGTQAEAGAKAKDKAGGNEGEGPSEEAKGTERVSCGAFTGNHGQYVSARPDDPSTPVNEREEAAKSECGKPVASTKDQPAGPGNINNGKKPEDPGKPGDAGRPAEAGKPAGVGKTNAAGGSSGAARQL